MVVTLNDKTKVMSKLGHERHLYNFIMGYLKGVFETRYTCKYQSNDSAIYYVIFNEGNEYQILAYKSKDSSPVTSINYPKYNKLEDVVTVLTGYRPRG